MLRLALLCHLSAVSAIKLAENVDCLPKRDDEIFVDFSGAKPQHFLLLVPRLRALASLLQHRCDRAAQQPGRGCRCLLRGNRWRVPDNTIAAR